MSEPFHRVVVLTEIPAPFRNPLFNALAAEPGISLDVLFLAQRDPKRPYPLYPDEMHFRWRILRSIEIVRGGRWVVVNAGVLLALARRRPDVLIIGGWNQPAFWLAGAYARVTGRPLVTWVESTARDARPGAGVLERAKRALVAASAVLLVPGQASAAYVQDLGVPPERVAIAPNAVDESIFGGRVCEARLERDAVRARLGLTRPTALYVGRLDPEKGVATAVAAVAGLNLDLVVIGAGVQETELKALAPANVRFLGRIERDDLVPWYAAVDMFVLPSLSEQWGMVLNEAAAAGLPIVASEAAGAAWDLVDDGVNGFRVPVGDIAAIASALARLAADPTLRATCRARSLALAAEHLPQAWATAVAGVVRRVASGAHGSFRASSNL